MKQLLQFIIDTIYPPSKDALLVRDFYEDDIDNLFNIRQIDGITCLTNFKDRNTKALIHETKFHNNKKSTLILGKLLAKYLEKTNLGKSCVFIPIPLSKARHRARGHNQVDEVLKKALGNLNIQPNTKILRRTTDTKPQANLPREERLKNVKGAFSITDTNAVYGKRIVLVDDVLTTGATLNEAKATLLPHSPTSITCIALAH